MGPDLRLAFPKGCRVRLNTRGRLVIHRREPRVGTVEGYSRDGTVVYVRWEGTAAKISWHRDFVERV